MKLRVRDTKSAIGRSKKANANRKTLTTSLPSDCNKDENKISIENEKVSFDKLTVCFQQVSSFFTARCHYTSSFTNSRDVTFATTEKVRLSTRSNYEPIIPEVLSDCAEAIQTEPIDLSSHSQYFDARYSSNLSINSEDLRFSPAESCSIDDIDKQLNFSSPNITLIDSRVSSNVSSTFCEFQQNFSSKSDMLSSRRHRSDETFQDRENLSSVGRNASYPHSAEAWLDSRCSPDQTDDIAAEQSDASESARTNDVSVYEEEELTEEQEVAFNYSTKNLSRDSTPERNTEAKLMRAKRERIENVVTSIKDKPSSKQGVETSFDAGTENEIGSSQSKKRKMGEQIKQLQRQLDTLQKEQDECDSEVYDENENIYDVENDVTEQGEDWSPRQKRPRYANDGETVPAMSRDRGNNGFYRGSINFMVPQNGRRQGTDFTSPSIAYQVLVQSIKQELGSALEKVAEESAKRILVELHKGSGAKNNSQSNENTGNVRNKSNVDRFSFKEHQFNERGATFDPQNKHYHPSKRYDNAKSIDRATVLNARQGGRDIVQMGKNGERSHEEAIRHQKSVSNTSHGKAETETWEKSSNESRHSPEMKRTSEPFDIQTQALSLVMKKSSSPLSTKSSPTPEDRPFVIRDPVGRASSGPPSPHHDRDNSVKDFSKVYRGPVNSFDPSMSSCKNPLDAAAKRKLFQPSLFSDASYFSSPSSAFRLPMRNDASALRRETFTSANMLKTQPFSLGTSLYPSTGAHSQPVFPFSTGPLPFPLLQSFQQRSLANALADYGRFREGFEHGPSRPVSTRTSTREPPRPSTLARSHHGHKPDHLDFRGPGAEVSRYSAASIQEGLTPQHLKKAKLMFFFTRYPSANTLKTFFADVKFSRATTSQLIKWFSNFREFYYIQMEKFARQSLSDGVTDINQLHVTRESELFRVLNLHYNKSNDFRVPSEFLTVTVRSLQEFFLAIQKGKDHDPSWKKVIYKIICKLDQDIPDLFKLPNILERLDEVPA